MDMNMKEYVNWKMSHDIKYGENEGYPLVLEDCRKNKDLKNLQIYGNSIQDGEPTPENPIEIQSVGELTTKNLLNYDLNSIGSSPNASSLKSFVVSNLIKFDSGTYTLSYNISNATTYRLHWVVFSDNGQTELITEARTYAKVTLKANSDTGYYNTNLGFFLLNGNTRVSYNDVEITVSQPCYIGFYVSGGDMSIESVVTEQQLELGEVKTEYEPYHKYKIPVRARGKNLLNVQKTSLKTASANGLTAEPYKTGGVHIYGKPTKASQTVLRTGISNTGQKVYLKSGCTITMKLTLDALYDNVINSATVSYQTSFNDSNGWYMNFSTSLNAAGKTTIKKDVILVNYDAIIITPTDTDTYLDFVICPQIEQGNTSTSYEPYIEPQTFNIYLDEPLRGMYSRRWNRTERDYIDFKKSVVVRKFLKEVYNGSEKWVALPSKENTFGKQYLKKVSQYGICSHYGDSQTTGVDGRIYLYVTSQAYITDSRFNTVEEFKVFLAEQASLGTPVTVVYCTYDAYNGSPIEEPIELPELPKTQAKTMIYEVIDTTIKPSNMYSKYIKKY